MPYIPLDPYRKITHQFHDCWGFCRPYHDHLPFAANTKCTGKLCELCVCRTVTFDPMWRRGFRFVPGFSVSHFTTTPSHCPSILSIKDFCSWERPVGKARNPPRGGFSSIIVHGAIPGPRALLAPPARIPSSVSAACCAKLPYRVSLFTAGSLPINSYWWRHYIDYRAKQNAGY